MNIVIVIALVDTLQERVHLLTVMTLAIPQIMKMKVMLMQVKINFIIGAVELNVVSGHDLHREVLNTTTCKCSASASN